MSTPVGTVLTDADLTYFWLGPLGHLRQLPLLPVSGTTNATEEVIGGLGVSLAGTGTLDVWGLKRTWQLDWVCLTWEETMAVHAMFQGLTRSPVRVVDPRAGNWLTRDGASGGSYNRDVTAHTVTEGTRQWVSVSDYPALFAGLVDGAVEWSVPDSTAGELRVDEGGRVPLIPEQQITVTLWVKGSGNAQVGVRLYDVAGSDAGTSLNTAVTLSGWAAYSRTFTPAAGEVSAFPVVAAESGSARDVTVGPALWHPTNTDWVPGGGCPRVLLTNRVANYPGLAHQNVDLTVREV